MIDLSTISEQWYQWQNAAGAMAYSFQFSISQQPCLLQEFRVGGYLQNSSGDPCAIIVNGRLYDDNARLILNVLENVNAIPTNENGMSIRSSSFESWKGNVVLMPAIYSVDLQIIPFAYDPALFGVISDAWFMLKFKF